MLLNKFLKFFLPITSASFTVITTANLIVSYNYWNNTFPKSHPPALPTSYRLFGEWTQQSIPPLCALLGLWYPDMFLKILWSKYSTRSLPTAPLLLWFKFTEDLPWSIQSSPPEDLYVSYFELLYPKTYPRLAHVPVIAASSMKPPWAGRPIHSSVSPSMTAGPHQLRPLPHPTILSSTYSVGVLCTSPTNAWCPFTHEYEILSISPPFIAQMDKYLLVLACVSIKLCE